MDVAIDCSIRQTVYYDLLSSLKEMGCTDMQFKLLCFWGRHRKAKLSLYTIARALDTSAMGLRDAITNLVEKGIITAKQDDYGLTTYVLSEQGAGEYIDELGSLDWNQKMNLERQLKEKAVSPVSKSE